MNNVTTKTNIIDIENAIEEKDGLPVRFQKALLPDKKVKNNHTVGFYGIQKEHELHLMGRLRGGGKRGRGGGSNKMSRDEKIEEKRNELTLTLLQLDQYKSNPIVATTLSSISLFTTGMTPTIIKDAIDNVLAMEQLKTLHAGLSAHQEDTRLKALAKQIFMRDLKASSDARKAMDLNIKAIACAITLGFYNNYFMENGVLDWAIYTTHIMKATDARGGLCPKDKA